MLLRIPLILAALFLLLYGLLIWISKGPGERYAGPFKALSPEEKESMARLKEDVWQLAEQIGPRDIGKHPKALASAREYIRAQLQATGLEVQSEPYKVGGQSVENLIAERRGSESPERILLIGAHYDSVEATPGADDNASGVAALLEIARLLKEPRKISLRFVAFVNEEPPFFGSDEMGSFVNARGCLSRGDEIQGMLALEMLGYYRGEAGSQSYPPPLSLVYPDRGDFITFVGDWDSRALVRDLLKHFRARVQFPSELLIGHKMIPGVDFSDHRNFWQMGYPAMMITDTAFYRNQNYHEPTDRADTLDYPRLARLTRGLALALADYTDEL